LKKYKNFSFTKNNLEKEKILNSALRKFNPSIIIHLAAQAGVRFSIYNPKVYFKSNIEGFFNLINLSLEKKIKHFIFASSSSVYGDQIKFPLRENFNTDNPKSFYAATKKSNEIMAYSYSSIYGMNNTALRFFTLYGSYGRPDMAIFKFTNSIFKNKKIQLFNNGNHFRDFTHIDTFLHIIEKLIFKPSKKKTPFNIFNIGNGKSETLMKFIDLIEKNLNKKSKIIKKPLQRGDVLKTHSSIKKITNYLLLKKKNISKNLRQGIKDYVNWYRSYYSK
jgi:UDP-glucuronate 4-epimerase